MSDQAPEQEKIPVPEGPEYEPLKKAYQNVRVVQDIVDNADKIEYIG